MKDPRHEEIWSWADWTSFPYVLLKIFYVLIIFLKFRIRLKALFLSWKFLQMHLYISNKCKPDGLVNFSYNCYTVHTSLLWMFVLVKSLILYLYKYYTFKLWWEKARLLRLSFRCLGTTSKPTFLFYIIKVWR